MLNGLGKAEHDDQRVGEDEGSSPSVIVHVPLTQMMATTLDAFMIKFRFESVHDCCGGRKGWTPLRYAVLYFGKSREGEPIIQEMLDRGADVEATLERDDKRVSHTAGFNVLHSAAACSVSLIYTSHRETLNSLSDLLSIEWHYYQDPMRSRGKSLCKRAGWEMSTSSCCCCSEQRRGS